MRVKQAKGNAVKRVVGGGRKAPPNTRHQPGTFAREYVPPRMKKLRTHKI